MEIDARIMLAWCMLISRDLESGREQLSLVEPILDPLYLRSQQRFQRVRVRYSLDPSSQTDADVALKEYLHWAEAHDCIEEVLDACELLAQQSELEERVDWYQRAIEFCLVKTTDVSLGPTYQALAIALDQLGRHEEAMECYVQALLVYQQQGTTRDWVAASWAVGALACRMEDWPLARKHLEEAHLGVEKDDNCKDLEGLILADLSQAAAASGDVIEARRLLIRAMQLGREHDLESLWPDRWASMQEQAIQIGLDA